MMNNDSLIRLYRLCNLCMRDARSLARLLACKRACRTPFAARTLLFADLIDFRAPLLLLLLLLHSS